MFSSLRLCEAFEYVLSPEEWSWFGPMAARRVMHFDTEGWPVFEFAEMQAYPRVWQRAADRALQKRRDGEWIAEGISARFGPQPRRIDTNLWDYLRLKDLAEEAEGSGFHFVALTISSLEIPTVHIPHAYQPALRNRLTQWIRAHAQASSLPVLRADQLVAAREAFPDCRVTNHMYRECRRAAELSAEAVQRGRPKKKAGGF